MEKQHAGGINAGIPNGPIFNSTVFTEPGVVDRPVTGYPENAEIR
jgi:hypothetical protein